MIGVSNPDPRQFEFLHPFVRGWEGKLVEARRSKQWFTDLGRECMVFFCGSAPQFWDPSFLTKYVKGDLSPKFRMTMSKAFEFVALLGPSLYWQNAIREVRLKKSLDLQPEDLQALDPMMQQLLGQVLQAQASIRPVDELRAWLVERILNYTPLEQPYGGLVGHSMAGVTEAMIKGRGLSWTETFQMPGSNRTLTGSFFGSVDELLIDPDAESLETAHWIARERWEPTWVVEEKFRWPRGSLKFAGTLESQNYQGQALGNDTATMERKQSSSQDYMRYFEIYSKCGPGTRLSGVTSPIAQHLDQVVGKYAYVAICPAVPSPLNCRSEDLRGSPWKPGASDEDVKRMFRWPTPTWTDDRWPVQALDLYPKPRSAWPIPPMGPGIGELIFLNVFTSHLANRTWSSTRDFIVVLERACDRIEQVMRSGDDLAIIKLKESHGKIEEVLQFVKQNEANADSWQIIDMMADRFADRVGLPEVMYAKNPGGRMPRTATDVESRRDFANVRVEYMAQQVELWEENKARSEMFAMRYHCKAQDFDGLFGPAEQMLYEMLIGREPIESVVREMRATITAGSARRPNKERDAQNINATVATMLPVLVEYAAATGDSGPTNAYLKMWLNAIEMDAEGLELGQWLPQPPPGAEEQAALEQQKIEGDLQGQQMDLQGKQIDQQTKLIQAQAAMEKLKLDMEKAMLDLHVQREKSAMDLATTEAKGAQQIQQQQQQHLLQMVQTRQQGQQKVSQMKSEGGARVQMMKRMAAAKPKPKAKAKATVRAR